MKNNKIKMSLRIGALVLAGVLIGVTASARAAWTNPTATPPSGNADAPLNTGSTAQSSLYWQNLTNFWCGPRCGWQCIGQYRRSRGRKIFSYFRRSSRCEWIFSDQLHRSIQFGCRNGHSCCRQGSYFSRWGRNGWMASPFAWSDSCHFRPVLQPFCHRSR